MCKDHTFSGYTLVMLLKGGEDRSKLAFPVVAAKNMQGDLERETNSSAGP